ncbi:SUMF1/EgtB/PvdO family nonheme iron enzyme [Sorangium sp. So ce302]|uniref:formylglycine-generating enzyme family protein n=1 Tax=Sorangium sp. So ce302 TaxID=3133297 RepID=UPI003F5DB7C6
MQQHRASCCAGGWVITPRFRRPAVRGRSDATRAVPRLWGKRRTSGDPRPVPARKTVTRARSAPRPTRGSGRASRRAAGDRQHIAWSSNSLSCGRSEPPISRGSGSTTCSIDCALPDVRCLLGADVSARAEGSSGGSRHPPVRLSALLGSSLARRPRLASVLPHGTRCSPSRALLPPALPPLSCLPRPDRRRPDYGTWTANAGDNEMLPLTFMNWYEAHAFCIWDGGFLPTEAEWKYATAGGDEQRMYPWGSMDPGSGNQYAIYDCYYPSGRRGTCTGVVNVPDVGSTPLGVGRFGQWDLSGSVWEWNLDVYANYVSPSEDCANLTGATNRVLPGGGFHTGLMPYLLSSNRSAVSYDPANYRGDYGVGVRCARTP